MNVPDYLVPIKSKAWYLFDKLNMSVAAIAEKLGSPVLAVSYWIEEAEIYFNAVKWNVPIDELDWSPYDRLKAAA